MFQIQYNIQNKYTSKINGQDPYLLRTQICKNNK